MMDVFYKPPDYKDTLGVKNQKDTGLQIILSAVLGLSAFVGFCILRPRWKSLYEARKKMRNEASPLPELPNTFFGWIPVVYKITEQQLLASAGLDAYVFLRFFKMSSKFLAITLFFSLVVFKPVHDANPEPSSKHSNHTHHDSNSFSFSTLDLYDAPIDITKSHLMGKVPTDYLWMYLVFTYVLSGIIVYMLVTETYRIIGIRQQFLGSKHTVADRTIRLSGIPLYLRSEKKIKEYIENLDIGHVDSITLCCNWQELDDCVAQRMNVLRKLEEAWTVYLGQHRVERNLESLPISQPLPQQERYRDEEEDDEDGPSPRQRLNGNSNHGGAKPRPQATLRFGFLKLRSRNVDAIDYYEDVLAGLDKRILDLRTKEFVPTPLAFVTMNSVSSCQMAVQAVLDPSPLHLIAKISPVPADVVWRNTYMPRWHRMSRAWTITIIITLLTVFWSILLVPLAGILNITSIKKVWPELGDALVAHPIAASLVETQLPTLLTSLLFVAVPYLYDWLSNLQGMTSQGDIDLSVIGKNFFFVFFNYFIVFTLLGTFSNFYDIWGRFEDTFKDTTQVAYWLASSLQGLTPFYTNLIILQGIGLFPFRLIEFGSVALYPLFRMGCKTPRDYAELVQPPCFYYGFYLPQVMLIFIICIVYCLLRESWRILLAGLIYFLIGGFVYKYQLLYAMDHRQQATGRGWIMICNRIIVGLVFFQLNMAGQMALKGGVKRAVAVAPLLIVTIWFSVVYSRSYAPLMEYISLGSIDRSEDDTPSSPMDPDGWGAQARMRNDAETRDAHVVDTTTLTGTRFQNPSLIAPLEDVWIADNDIRAVDGSSSDLVGRRRLEGAINAAV